MERDEVVGRRGKLGLSLALVLTLLAGCVYFDTIDQPTTAVPGDTLAVTFTGHDWYSDSGTAYIGILVPDSGDFIPIFVGVMVIDTDTSYFGSPPYDTTYGFTTSFFETGRFIDTLNIIVPPPAGYKWLAGSTATKWWGEGGTTQLGVSHDISGSLAVEIPDTARPGTYNIGYIPGFLSYYGNADTLYVDDSVHYRPLTIVDMTDTLPPDIAVIDTLTDTYFPGPFTIRSVITDSQFVANAYLIYDVNAGGWDTLTMTQTSGDTFSADIPAGSAGDSIAYYIWAEDPVPNGASSDTFSFKILVDTQAPVVNLLTYWADTGFTGPYPVSAEVIDVGSGVDSALLYYQINSGGWNSILMSETATDTFTDTIPSASSGDVIEYYVYAVDLQGNSASSDTVTFNVVGIEENRNPQRFTFYLSKGTPNPFVRSSGTTIVYSIPEKTNVVLNVYNSAGQRVRTLVNATQASGIYSVVWRGKDDAGKRLASGIYFYRISAGKYSDTKRVLLLR